MYISFWLVWNAPLGRKGSIRDPKPGTEFKLKQRLGEALSGGALAGVGVAVGSGMGMLYVGMAEEEAKAGPNGSRPLATKH